MAETGKAKAKAKAHTAPKKPAVKKAVEPEAPSGDRIAKLPARW